jgi:transposase
MAEGVVISDVARRNGISPQQLFGWRRQRVKAAVPPEAPSFVPAVADGAMKPVPASEADDRQNVPGTIEIVFVAVVVRLNGRIDGWTPATVLKALGTQP